MDNTILYLRDQESLLTEIKAKTRLGSSNRWTDAEYYTALNEILMTWADHVKLPFVYTIPDGWQASTYAYELPAYVRPPIFPQLLRHIPYTEYVIESRTATWQDIPGWELEPDGEGGNVLRLHAPPRTVEGRVLYYAPNSRVPITIPTTSAGINADDISVTLGSAVDVDDVGFIKIDAEWISYQGVTRGTSTTTLNNLTRGLYGTTAATHDSGSSVYWGIAADTISLYKLLHDQWRSYLAAYFIQDGGTHEIERHEKTLGYYEQLATNYFATYKPTRKRGGISLNRKVFLLTR